LKSRGGNSAKANPLEASTRELRATLAAQVTAKAAVKAAIKNEAVSEVISMEDIVTHTIYNVPGRCNFFECRLTNPYLDDKVFAVQFQDPELRLVTDAAQWRVLKGASGLGTPAEQRMFWQSSEDGPMRLYLQGKETVFVPFMLQHFDRQEDADQVLAPTPRKVVVEIVCISSGKAIAKMEVNVVAAGTIIDRVHRFDAPENKQFVVALAMPPGCTAIHCANPDVRAEIEPSVQGEASALIKYRCGAAQSPERPNTVTFLVHCYADQYGLVVQQTWQIHITALQSIFVTGRVGESTTVDIPISSWGGIKRQVAAHSGRPLILRAIPGEVTQLDPETGGTIHMDLNCVSPGGTDVVVNVVDRDSFEIVGVYLVAVTASLPSVKEVYQMEIAAHTGARKKIAFTNPYDATRQFTLSTDRADLLQFTESTLQFAAKESLMIGLVLSPTDERGGTEVYIFINDHLGRNEDTLQLVISYF